MRRPLHQSSVIFLTKIVCLTMVFFGVYYLLSIRPALALHRTFSNAERVLSEHRMNLLQHRIALTGWTKLRPDSDRLAEEQDALLSAWNVSQTKGLALLQNAPHLPILSSGPKNNARSFYNNHLLPALPDLFAKTETVYREQEALKKELEDAHRVLKNIFRYNATFDLGTLDLRRDRDTISARAFDAKSGLTAIAERLSTLPPSPEIRATQTALQKTIGLLNSFISALANGRFSTADRLRRDVIRQFSVLRASALQVVLAIIRSEKSVSQITRQTNLILEYDYWLKNIKRHQRSRVRIPSVVYTPSLH